MRPFTERCQLAFMIEDHVAPQLADGRLVRVLDDWYEPFDVTTFITPVADSRRRPSAYSWRRLDTEALSRYGQPTHHQQNDQISLKYSSALSVGTP
jgi:hypothetical protein